MLSTSSRHDVFSLSLDAKTMSLPSPSVDTSIHGSHRTCRSERRHTCTRTDCVPRHMSPDDRVTSEPIERQRTTVSRTAAATLGKPCYVSRDCHVTKKWSNWRELSSGDEEGEKEEVDILLQWRVRRRLEQARREAKQLHHAGKCCKDLLTHHTSKECNGDKDSSLLVAKSQIPQIAGGHVPIPMPLGDILMPVSLAGDNGNLTARYNEVCFASYVVEGRGVYCERQKERRQRNASSEEDKDVIRGREASILDRVEVLIDQVYIYKSYWPWQASVCG